MKILLTTLNAKFIHSSLALRCLTTACEAAGVEGVTRAEYTINQQPYDILRHIYGHRPDILGFSCYIWNIAMTYRIIALVRQVLPDTLIVVGGPEVSYTARDILEEHPDIDFVFQGEGEDIWPAFIREREAGRDGTDITGVLGRVEGVLKGNTDFREVPDLSKLPFPYTGEDLHDLDHKIMYYESSRGCPFHCQYCLSGMSDDVRFRDVPTVLKELQYFVDAGVHQVKFVDRTFNCNPRHYRPLLEYMVSVKEPINFHLEIEPGLITDDDLAILKRAPKGRIQLEIGIQSTYEPTLRAIHRHNDWDRITHIMKEIRSYGNIHLHLDLIVGLPYEDYDWLQESFNDIYHLQPHKLQIGFLKLLKGSGIRRDYPRDYRYDPYGPYEVLETTWLSYEEIRYMKVFEDVFERTYNSGKFSYTLDFLSWQYTNYPFALYERMTNEWLRLHYDDVAISDETLCRFLWHCIEKLLSLRAEDIEICRELLALDIMVTFGFRLKPDFLGWDEAQRSETDRLFRDEAWMNRFVKGYHFTNWRDVKMHYHIWPVSKATKRWLFEYTSIPPGPAYILAEKKGKQVTWHVVPKVNDGRTL